MKPRLIALSGPLAGNTIELQAPETTIGRDTGCDLFVPDELISRPHCCVARTGETTFEVRDLDSHNQTFLNGRPVRAHPLRHGDQIQVGASVFAFLSNLSTEIPDQQVFFEDDGGQSGADTRSLRFEDSCYLQATTRLGGSNDDRKGRDLEVFLAVARALGRYRKFEELKEHLLDLILEAISADGGAILLDPHGPPDSKDFASALIRQRGPSSRPFRLSRTVIGHALEKREAILSNEVSTDDHFRESDSLRSYGSRSILVVPIPDEDRVAGLIYLSSDQADAFDEDDLQLITGITGVAAAPLENLRRLESWQSEIRSDEDEAVRHNILGESEAIGRVRTDIDKVAGTSATVLIVGETGVGKELVARAIHRASTRSRKPSVDLNCASLKHELVEGDLFGSEPGGFTGAVKRKGKLEIADGGTLFLDEIGELESRAQASLLRVLETGKFQRVGGNQTIEVDIRLIAATNVDLAAAVQKGAFREDLYHRLNVFRIDVPPLRERREDIPRLAAYFANKAAARHGRTVAGLTRKAQSCVMHHDWPGNIRQLQNAMEYAVISMQSDVIGVEDLPQEVIHCSPADGGAVPKLYQAVNEATGHIILDALRSSEGKVSAAARILGVHPNNLHRLIARLGLRRELDEIRGKGRS